MPEKYGYDFTKTARSDLEDIDDYTTNVLMNPDAAVSFIDELENKIEETCKSPKSGREVHNEYMKRDDVRRFLVKNYICYYIIDDSEKKIIVLRVAYSGMDQDKIIAEL